MFTDADLALLSRPLHAFITTAPRDDRLPAPRPVWFEVTDEGTIQIFSVASAPRVARLREDPRASVVVVAPVGEPEHWVSIDARASLYDDGARDLAIRLTDRYWTGDDPAHQDALENWDRLELVRIVFDPEKVRRFKV